MSKYEEILKKLSYEQLVFEKAILDKEKTNIFIRDKELNEEFKRRLEEENKNGK